MKKISVFFAIVILSNFVLQTSCTKEKVNLEKDVVEIIPVSECDSLIALQNGRYACQVKPIIIANCATSGCHVQGGSGPDDFNNYFAVKEKVDNGSFQSRVLDGPNWMPYDGPLPQDQLDVLQAWVDNGAPND